MALWKDSSPGTPAQPPATPAKESFTREPERPVTNVAPLNADTTKRTSTSTRERPEMKESVIA